MSVELADRPPGCGLDRGLENGEMCAAKHGYRPVLLSSTDWTVGVVGLCRTCLEHPADLLQRLSEHCRDTAATTIDGAGQKGDHA